MNVSLMIGKFLVIVVLMLLEGLSSGSIRAQAFDPNCYFPQIGQPGVIDTIYGSAKGQLLGVAGSFRPPDSTYATLFISGLPVGIPYEPIRSAVRTGPKFNLHKLQIFDTSHFPQSLMGYPVHVRNTRYPDMLLARGGWPTIYWADANGRFDSSRSTTLMVKHGPDSVADPGVMQPYVAPLLSDSVDDIVYGVELFPDTGSGHVEGYMCFIQGGESLYNRGRVAYPDSIVHFAHIQQDYLRFVHPGHYRRAGTMDLITGDLSGNHFFYKNEKPFSLQNFVRSLFMDTLTSRWDNPNRIDNGPGQDNSYPYQFALKAFAKIDESAPDDWWLAFTTKADSIRGHDGHLRIYRGGPDFSTHRFGDSAAMEFYDPAHYGYNVDPHRYRPLGDIDISGSGNGLFAIEAEAPFTGNYNYLLFYVLGDAIDDKADMEIIMDGFPLVGEIDSLTADGDNIEDIAIGRDGYNTVEDLDKGITEVGTIQIVHGTKRIPAHRSGVQRISASSLTCAVMPTPSVDNATIELSGLKTGHTCRISIRDLLGRLVYSTEHVPTSSNLVLKLGVSSVSSGVYILLVESQDGSLSQKLIVQR
jgi:hypothetical protein